MKHLLSFSANFEPCHRDFRRLSVRENSARERNQTDRLTTVSREMIETAKKNFHVNRLVFFRSTRNLPSISRSHRVTVRTPPIRYSHTASHGLRVYSATAEQRRTTPRNSVATIRPYTRPSPNGRPRLRRVSPELLEPLSAPRGGYLEFRLL